MKCVEKFPTGAVLLEPDVHADSRGMFFETYNELEGLFLGIAARFVQDNHSRSMQNVLRGLHYQIQSAQGKLVRVVAGEIYDVAVELRRNSPQFGEWHAVRLSAENRRMLYIPPGMAHGFLTLSESADVLYKTSDYYAPQHERTIRWDDPDLAIDWPLSAAPILSNKDRAGVPFCMAEVYDGPVPTRLEYAAPSRTGM